MGFKGGRGAFGRGVSSGGRGWRNMFFATGTPGWMRRSGYAGLGPKVNSEMEKQALKKEAEGLQAELGLIKKRLGEMESETASKEEP
jgi:hypothetical protein